MRLPVLSAPAATAITAESVYTRPDPKTVRVSVTDRCDLACTYCRPSRNDGYYESRLSGAAWRTLFAGLRDAGVSRIRFTGGEPLLCADLPDRIAEARALGFSDIALTTNGTRLARMAKALHDAGLSRLTLSLDTLQPERFFAITRGGDLHAVLQGLDAALTIGFAEVKINTVVIRDVNQDEIVPLCDFAWARAMTPRFLEIMPIGEGANVQHALVPYAEILAPLRARLEEVVPLRDPERGPAKYLRAKHDPTLRVGFITGTSDTYCNACDRLRVTARGEIRPCLATPDSVQADSTDPARVAAQIHAAWQHKPDGRTFKGCTEPSAKHMSIRQIGG
jgi:GTP 3',8-cyclase